MHSGTWFCCKFVTVFLEKLSWKLFSAIVSLRRRVYPINTAEDRKRHAVIMGWVMSLVQGHNLAPNLVLLKWIMRSGDIFNFFRGRAGSSLYIIARFKKDRISHDLKPLHHVLTNPSFFLIYLLFVTVKEWYGFFVMCMVRKSDKIWLDEDFIQVIYLYTFVSRIERNSAF